MVHVRVPAILARLQWVVEHHGEPAFEATIGAMKPELAAAVRGAVDPSSWVPFEAFVGLCEVIDARYGKGDLALCRELGRYAARVNVPTIYRLFFRFGTVRYIIGKAASVWSEIYDSGRASTRDLGPREIAVLIEDFATPHRAHCLSVLGWIEASVAISGSRLVASEETACRTRGAAACEMRVRYE